MLKQNTPDYSSIEINEIVEDKLKRKFRMRLAQFKDRTAILKVIKQSTNKRNTWTIPSKLEHSEFVMVLEGPLKSNIIVGFLYGRYSESELKKSLWIELCCVHKQFQSKGLGRALLAEATIMAKTSNCIRMCALIDSPDSGRILGKSGFMSTKEDRDIVVKPLTSKSTILKS